MIKSHEQKLMDKWAKEHPIYNLILISTITIFMAVIVPIIIGYLIISGLGIFFDIPVIYYHTAFLWLYGMLIYWIIATYMKIKGAL